VWTFQHEQQATIYQSNEHTKPVTCIKLSVDGKTAVTGRTYTYTCVVWHVLYQVLCNINISYFECA
jgi:hypothetical protein